eukprot:352367-Chlamydomonas_euryale.AAC.1
MDGLCRMCGGALVDASMQTVGVGWPDNVDAPWPTISRPAGQWPRTLAKDQELGASVWQVRSLFGKHTVCLASAQFVWQVRSLFGKCTFCCVGQRPSIGPFVPPGAMGRPQPRCSCLARLGTACPFKPQQSCDCWAQPTSIDDNRDGPSLLATPKFQLMGTADRKQLTVRVPKTSLYCSWLCPTIAILVLLEGTGCPQPREATASRLGTARPFWRHQSSD